MSDSIHKNCSGAYPDSNRVFMAFGQVAYAIQIFEADLVTLLIILKRISQMEWQLKTSPESFLSRELVATWWRREGERIQSKLVNQTLGQLLKNELKQCREDFQNVSANVVPVDILDTINGLLDTLPFVAWEGALERRNYLVHSFFYDGDDQLTCAKGCRTLLEVLGKDKERFEKHVVEVRNAIDSAMVIMEYNAKTLNGNTE